MSFPFAQQTLQSLNPIENIITSVNSNPYFIGFMMLLLNLVPEKDFFLGIEGFLY